MTASLQAVVRAQPERDRETIALPPAPTADQLASLKEEAIIQVRLFVERSRSFAETLKALDARASSRREGTPVRRAAAGAPPRPRPTPTPVYIPVFIEPEPTPTRKPSGGLIPDLLGW